MSDDKNISLEFKNVSFYYPARPDIKVSTFVSSELFICWETASEKTEKLSTSINMTYRADERNRMNNNRKNVLPPYSAPSFSSFPSPLNFKLLL